MNSQSDDIWTSKLARDEAIAGWFGLAALAIALLLDAYFGWPV